MASQQQQPGPQGHNENNENNENTPSLLEPLPTNNGQHREPQVNVLDRRFRFHNVSIHMMGLHQALPSPYHAVVERILTTTRVFPNPVYPGMGYWHSRGGTLNTKPEPQYTFLDACHTIGYRDSGVQYIPRQPWRSDKKGSTLIFGYSHNELASQMERLGSEFKHDVVDDSGVVILPFLSVEGRHPGEEPTWGRPWVAECETAVAATEAIGLMGLFNHRMRRANVEGFTDLNYLHFGVMISDEEARLFVSILEGRNRIMMKHVRTWSLTEDASFAEYRRVMRTAIEWGIGRMAHVREYMDKLVAANRAADRAANRPQGPRRRLPSERPQNSESEDRASKRARQ